MEDFTVLRDFDSTTCTYQFVLNGENSSALSDHKQFYETAQFITGLILYPAFCLFGVVGNFLSLIILCRTDMEYSTNIYLSGLCVSDMTKLLNDSLYFLTILFLRISPENGHKMYAYLYPYAHYIFNMTLYVSSWLVVAVAAERYILVCQVARSKRYCTLKKAKLVTSAVFITMGVLAVPFAFRYQTIYIIDNAINSSSLDVGVSNLWQDKTFSTTYTWIQNLLRSIIPLIILIVLNGFIIKSTRATRANRKLAKRNRITVMLITKIIVFCVCVTPDAVMSTILGFGYHESSLLAKGIREITDFLLTFNSATNIILYTLLNPKFRAHFVHACCPVIKEVYNTSGNTNSILNSRYNDTLLTQMNSDKICDKTRTELLRQNYADSLASPTIQTNKKHVNEKEESSILMSSSINTSVWV